MQIPRTETTVIDNLVKSFNESDSFYALNTRDDGIDDILWSETRENFEEKSLKNKYWKIVKNHISVAFFFSKKAKLSKFEKKENVAPQRNIKTKPAITERTAVYLSEREWFIKKCEREVGKPITKDMVPFSVLEKDIRKRKTHKRENSLYQEYKEPPRPDDIPDIVWDGPSLKCCFCISPMDNCDCKGDMVLPPHNIPRGIPKNLKICFHCLQRLPYFKNLKLPVHQVPEKPFAQRIQEHLEMEAAVQTQLKEMNLQRGPEFCVFRCYHYYKPAASETGRYFKTKKELYYAYKNNQPIVDESDQQTAPAPAKREISISDEFIDGLYRSVSTQGTTDEDGEFVMGDVSHILFGKGDASVLQDIEGTPYCVCSYTDVIKKKSPTVVKRIENLLSISGIKKRVSKLTSNFMSSIVEIKDPGIPSNTRATQDPSLDNNYESIKIPSKYKFVKETEEEICPCCKKYKELQTYGTERFESNAIDNNEHMELLMNSPFLSEMERMEDKLDSFIDKRFKKAGALPKSLNKEGLFDEKLLKQTQQLRISDNETRNIVGKHILPKKHPLTETKGDDENKYTLKNINENDMKLLKQNLVTNKKNISFEKNKDLYAIQSESILNVEENISKQKKAKYSSGLNIANGEIKKVGEDDVFETEEESVKNSNQVEKGRKKSSIKSIGIKNNQMNSLEFLESIKPCCIDNLYKQLERKILNEKFAKKLLEEVIFRRVDKCIHSREQKRLQDIEDNKIANNTNNDNVIEENKNLINDITDPALDEAKEDVPITKKEIESIVRQSKKKIDTLKSSFKINMNKLSDFVKKQKSSLKKAFTKTIKDAHIRSKSRKAFSLDDFKVKINKSFKKMNNAVSSFFKRHEKTTSNDRNSHKFTFIKNTNKKDSLEDSGSKSSNYSSNTIQNLPDTRDSKTSEKEVFSVQYNSTYEF